jgi:hypothetical protein
LTLVMRKQQMSELGAAVQSRLDAQLADVFMRNYPRECRQAGGEAAILGWVRSGLLRAAAAGCRSQFECGRWLSLMFILGHDFSRDIQLPWVRALLDDTTITDSTDRIALLYEQTIDYLGETAGEDAELVVRALLRMREIDFQALPQLDSEAWVADCCDRLHDLYPQKFDFQGAELTASAVRLHLARARSLGLSGAAGEFLFVLLAFMLGSGFDTDPLHGWASQILHGGGAPTADRAARLQAAAREHLSLSLSR